MNRKPSKFWRLADSVTIVQAALLIIDIEPEGVEERIEHSDAEKPEDYIAARDSILSAVQSGTLEGKIEYDNEQYVNPEAYVDDFGLTPDTIIVDSDVAYNKSRVLVTSLIKWLHKRGFEAAAFGKAQEESDFRDPQHPRYSQKLLAAVEAWENYDSKSHELGRPKQRLTRWLESNARRLGLTHGDGNLKKSTIEEIAKVANWDTGGGAPKTSSK